MNQPFNRTLLLALVALIGCADGESPSATDSEPTDASVSVVTAAELEQAPALRLEVATRIGALDGPEELRHFRVVDAALIGEEVWVLDAGDAELRVYGVDGAYHRTVGGRGEGPGEFQSPNSLEVQGDSVFVIGGSRLTVFGPGDSVVATGPSSIRNEEGRSWGVQNAGPVWVRYRRPIVMESLPRDVLRRDTSYVHLAEPLSGEFGPEIFRFAAAPSMSAGEMGWGMEPYYTSTPVTAAGPPGVLYYSPADEYRIDILDASTGALLHSVTSAMPLPPVTREMLDRAWEKEKAELADAPPGSEASMYAEVAPRRRNLEPPANRPILGTILPAPDGGFAVLRLDLDPDPLESGDPSTWDVFGPDRSLVGRFVTPAGTPIFGYYGDRLLALERDEFDVQFVTIYAIDGR